jgi:hypothetical protein
MILPVRLAFTTGGPRENSGIDHVACRCPDLAQSVVASGAGGIVGLFVR